MLEVIRAIDEDIFITIICCAIISFANYSTFRNHCTNIACSLANWIEGCRDYVEIATSRRPIQRKRNRGRGPVWVPQPIRFSLKVLQFQ
jgi:hypothetical protein